MPDSSLPAPLLERPMDEHPIILSIAASAALCSLALATPAGVLQWQSSDNNQHSEQILPAVAQLLQQADIDKPDLIAVDIGPGAFTSVRVACAVAQGLSLGWQCPVLAVPSLTALAQQALEFNPSLTTIVSIVDARMDECYVARYQVIHRRVDLEQALGHPLEQTLAPSLLGYAHVVDLNVDAVIGNAATVLPHWVTLAPLVLDAVPSALGVLAVAQQQLRSHTAILLAPEAVQPLYVRNRVAFTAAERLAGIDKQSNDKQ